GALGPVAPDLAGAAEEAVVEEREGDLVAVHDGLLLVDAAGVVGRVEEEVGEAVAALRLHGGGRAHRKRERDGAEPEAPRGGGRGEYASGHGARSCSGGRGPRGAAG